MKKVNILIGGDTVPTKSNYSYFAKMDGDYLFGSEILNIFREVDFRVLNLESPFSDTESPICKEGPNLVAPINTFAGIKILNPNLVTLANNHILDQGNQGYLSTIEVLEKNKVDHIGAGKNIYDSSKPFIYEKNGIKIGFYACAEHEFSFATEKKLGANSIDLPRIYEDILKLSLQTQYIIVLFHGGVENYRYPTPQLQHTCRKMVDYGASIVVCQHSHCIGSFEEYKKSTIIYGQGNFIFDNSSQETWQSSLLLNISFCNDKYLIEYIPIKKIENKIRVSNDKQIISEFYSRSNNITDDKFVYEEFMKIAKKRVQSYARKFVKNIFLFKIIYKIIGMRFVKIIFNKKNVAFLYDLFVCESHKEVVIETCSCSLDANKKESNNTWKK